MLGTTARLALVAAIALAITALGAVAGFALVGNPPVAALALVGLACCTWTCAGIVSRLSVPRPAVVVQDVFDARLRQLWLNAGGATAPTMRG